MSDGSEDVPPNPPTQDPPVAPAHGGRNFAAASAPTHPGQEDAPAALEPTRTSQPDRPAEQAPTHTSTTDRPAAQDPTRTSQPGPTTAATPPSIQPQPVVPQVRNPARYHHLGEHGRGGLGKVSRAHDLELGRDVAIKELLSRSAMHEVRFMREALITARLEHPGIVPVHEAGRWPDGTPFYAMKLVAGRPLRDLLAERKTVDERLALLHHVIAVADAIAYAHGRNIIHRDLKPSNVIVGDFGETVVIDWGLAKDLARSEESFSGGSSVRSSHNDDLTSAGAILGTPAYMAPEQRRGEPVDQRADVYAIGVMLWELCSLEKLPQHDSSQRHRILRRSNIDLDLITIIEKALAVNPEHRYADASDLAADLKAFKIGARIVSRRYSFRDLVTRWTHRHRVLTTSLLLSILLATIVGISYIRDITAERDRTKIALDIADTQRRQAIIANATALLERDPTQAWSVLATLSDDPERTSILRARIKAAGVASINTPLPGSIAGVLLTPNKQQIVLSIRENRTLDIIGIKTSKFRQLSKNLTAPPVFAVTDTHAFVVQNLGYLALSKIELASGSSEELYKLDQLPVDIMAGISGVFWQTPDGLLYQTLSSKDTRLVAADVAQFTLAANHVAVCDRKQQLYIIDLDTRRPLNIRMKGCKETWRWAERAGDLVIPADPEHILLYHHDNTYRIVSLPNDDNRSNFALSSKGIVVAVDAQGDGALLLPNSSSFEHVRLRQDPAGAAAGENLVAWAFRNGEVKVLNPFTRQEWSIKAHIERAQCMHFISDTLLLTCGRNELRIWTIPSNAPRVVAELPSPVFHILSNSSGARLLDTDNGETYLSSNDFKTTTLLHRHTQLAFGVAWCDSRACSAGWDGNIICRSPNASSSDSVASYGVPIRSFLSNAGHCFAAVSNGAVYDLRIADHPLYRHQYEPLRLATSTDGTLMASADWGGTLKIWDLTNRSLAASIERLHDGAIVAIIWEEDNKLLSAGTDGNLRLLQIEPNSKPITIQQWRLTAAIRYISASSNSIYAALEDGSLWHVNRTTGSIFLLPFRFEIVALAATKDHSYVAVGSIDGELFVIDERRRMIAKRLGGGGIQCITFDDDNTLFATTQDGRIFRFDLTKQIFDLAGGQSS